jgi:hypothetical protein
LAFDGDTNTGIWRSAADTLNVATNGVERVEFGTTEVVFNDGGGDFDFRIEGDTKPNLFKVDAGTDKVIVDGLTHPSVDGTADQALVTDGSGVLGFASRSRLVRGTAVAATSGTSIDFTGIPSWVRRITVAINGVSTNGTSPIQVQLGDSGGIETSGYVGGNFVITGANACNTASYTDGFVLIGVSAAETRHGALILVNPQSNDWVAIGNIFNASTGHSGGVQGEKATSATLDRIRLTTVNGTDTFDAGSINILYEG